VNGTHETTRTRQRSQFAKRSLDVVLSLAALAVAALPLAAVAIWVRFDSPGPILFRQIRVGRGGRPFHIHKFRTMRVGADREGLLTVGGDSRITRSGRVLRKLKIDELPQLFDVLVGNMSLVGPRPNVSRETDLYTAEERKMLDVRPGITDMASIAFSDEEELLASMPNPHLAYDQFVRPWKSRLGLFYVSYGDLGLDLQLIVLTAFAVVSRRRARLALSRLLKKRGAPVDLVRVASRRDPLEASPPPGATRIVV